MADRDVIDPKGAARSRGHGTTRDGSPVASRGGATLVAFALPPSGRPAADRHRVEDPHPAYVARKPPVGREPDCRRACEARVARLAAHGRQAPPEALCERLASIRKPTSSHPRRERSTAIIPRPTEGHVLCESASSGGRCRTETRLANLRPASPSRDGGPPCVIGRTAIRRGTSAGAPRPGQNR
jgi:hypothetical protein